MLPYSSLIRLPPCLHHNNKVSEKRCNLNQRFSIGKGTGLSPFVPFCWAVLFCLTLFLLHFSQLPSIAAPSEVNGHWKDNGMSSGLAWPLHLLLLWHHIGKLKQEGKKRGEVAREKAREMETENERVTDGGCVFVCVFYRDQGQYMALSSTALTIGNQKNQRPETKTTGTEV